MIDVLSEFKEYQDMRESTTIEEISSAEYYGGEYQDMQARVPDVSAARTQLGWEPQVDLRETLRRTIAYYVTSQDRMPSKSRLREPIH